MGPGRSQFSWVAAALTPPSNFEAISSRFRGDFGMGGYGDFEMLNTQRMECTTTQNMCLGCPKHQGPLLGATLHRRNGPGQSCKLVDNAHTSQTHLFDARVPHNIRNAQCSAYNRTHLRKNASNPPRIMGWLHRAGEQSHPMRKWQHTCRNTRTANERKQPKA